MLTGSFHKQPGPRSPGTSRASWAHARSCMCVCLCAWTCTCVRVHVNVNCSVCLRGCMCVVTSMWAYMCGMQGPGSQVHSWSLSRAGSRCLSGIGQHQGADWLAAGLLWTHGPGGEAGAASGDSHTVAAVMGSEQAAGLSSAPAGFPGRAGPAGSGVGWLVGQGAGGAAALGQGCCGQGIPRDPRRNHERLQQTRSESQTWRKGDGGGPGLGSC